jgi:hypothetical protein
MTMRHFIGNMRQGMRRGVVFVPVDEQVACQWRLAAAVGVRRDWNIHVRSCDVACDWMIGG